MFFTELSEKSSRLKSDGIPKAQWYIRDNGKNTGFEARLTGMNILALSLFVCPLNLTKLNYVGEIEYYFTVSYGE